MSGTLTGAGGRTAAAMHQNWSDLPAELLLLVAKRSIAVSDYIGFRSVCRSWRSAASPADLTPHLPLLMLPCVPFEETCNFFSLSANKVFVVSLPESRGKAVLNSDGGWLLMYDPSTNALSLLNPVTRAQYELPSTSEFAESRHWEAWLTFLSCKPNSDIDDCVIMITNWHHRSHVAAFCKARGTAWTVLNTGLGEGEIIVSMAYFGGRFYAITQRGKVSVCDPLAPSRPPTVMTIFTDMTSCTSFRFVVGKAGLLLLVGFSFTDERDEKKKEFFSSIKLHLGEHGLPRMVQIVGIEDEAAFVSNRGQLMLLPAEGIPGCKANHIYCTHFFDLHSSRDLQRLTMDVQGIWLLNLRNTLNYQVEYKSCGWRIPREALHEAGFALEPDRLAFAIRHWFPLSRWVVLSLS